MSAIASFLQLPLVCALCNRRTTLEHHLSLSRFGHHIRLIASNVIARTRGDNE